jgi:hypothetical protein
VIKFERGRPCGRIELQGGRAFSVSGWSVAGWTAVLLLFACSAFISSRIVDGRPTPAAQAARKTAARGNLLAEISRRPSFAFGFRNFLADMIWLKAVQVSGGRRMSRSDYDELYSLLDTAVNFDPKFKIPYYLGGLILGDSPHHAGEAISTLNRGWRKYPEEWRFPFYIGYIRYFSLGDPIEGGKTLLSAALIPGSAPYLPMLASRMLSEGREPETALAFLRAMVNQETNPGRREALLARIREVIVERDIQALERAVEAYRQGTGRLPASVADLAGAGVIREVPREPHGGRYLLSIDGKVRSDRIGVRMKVFRK